MGMFDRFYVKQPDPRFQCAEGHSLENVEFQSKEMGDLTLTRFLLYQNRLWSVSKGSQEVLYDHDAFLRLEAGVPRQDATDLVLRVEHPVLSSTLTGNTLVYATCPLCRPVLTYGESWAGESVQEHTGRVEFDLTFAAGILTEVATMKTDTREETKAQLRKQGLEVLDDDERIAKGHFKRWENRHRDSDED